MAVLVPLGVGDATGRRTADDRFPLVAKCAVGELRLGVARRLRAVGRRTRVGDRAGALAVVRRRGVARC